MYLFYFFRLYRLLEEDKTTVLGGINNLTTEMTKITAPIPARWRLLFVEGGNPTPTRKRKMRIGMKHLPFAFNY